MSDFGSSPDTPSASASPDTRAATTAGPPLHLRAIVTLVTTDAFVVGAQLLAYSLRQVGTQYPLYLLLTSDVSPASRLALSEAGFHLILVEPLAHANTSHVDTWVDVGYTKLRIWQLEQFERLLYLDADVLVKRNLDHLLGPAMDGVTFAAAPDTFPPDRFNAGVMLVRPSQHVFAALVRRMACTASYDGGDTGFLNAFFPAWFAATSSCTGPSAGQIVLAADLPPVEATLHSCVAYRRGVARLSFAYNALRTMQWFTKKAPLYWSAIGDPLVVHYCSSPKPWEDRRQQRGGFLEQDYFAQMDAFDREERAKKRACQTSNQALIDSLPIQFIPASHSCFAPAPSCIQALQHGKLSAFGALQVMVAENMTCLPLGEMDWNDSGKDDQHAAATTPTGQKESTSSEASSSPSSPPFTNYLLQPVPATAFGRPLHTATGFVRPVRRGVWLPADREESLIRTARLTLQRCLLDTTDPPTHQSLATPKRLHATIPKLIHQIWLGSPLPAEYADWCATWTKHHPPASGWTYRLWTDADLAQFPLCARLTDASSAFLSAHLQSLLPRCTSPAQVSDLLRLDLLWTLGGLYVDTDFECLASFAPFHDGGAWARHVQVYTCFSNVGAVECNNGLIASVPQHGLIGKLIQSVDLPTPTGAHISTAREATGVGAAGSSASAAVSSRPSQQHTAQQILTSSGPGHLTRTIAKYFEDWHVNQQARQHTESQPTESTPSSSASLADAAAAATMLSSEAPPILLLPTQVCYPLPNNMRQLTSPTDKALFLTPATFAVHHWSCSWQGKASGGAAVTSDERKKEARDQERKAEANANQLIQLAQAIQQANQAPPSGTTNTNAASSFASASTASAPFAATAAALNPLLLGKIAAFLKQ